jgi:hypothetical protein
MLKISTYDYRVELVDVEFRFLRFAVANLSRNRRKEFFKTITNEQIQNLHRGLQLAQKHMPETFSDEEILEIAERGRYNTKKKFAPRNRRRYEETIEDGLNASELLIRVALFEAFMKEIHAVILRAKPSLLGKIRPQREVKYENLFTEQSSYAQILNQEIIREVEEVDRKKFFDKPEYFDKTRAYYFAHHLKIPLDNDKNLEFLGEILQVRNEISHENPLKTVTPDLLNKAAKLLKQIPHHVFSKAQTLYGNTHFA